ncbi:MAG: aspartate 1-decarboxylase [Verrucomicrobiota bacterium]|nr:aspartate 1-decarboxylase [Verrucomicrobiota bacterium]
MQRIMMKSKIHRAAVTGLEIDYEGSISIDEDLLEAADILPGEQVHVLNLNSGARFETYAIRGRRGSGEMMLNGPAARLAVKGDLIIVLTYSPMSDAEARAHEPLVVKVDARNRPLKAKPKKRK